MDTTQEKDLTQDMSLSEGKITPIKEKSKSDHSESASSKDLSSSIALSAIANHEGSFVRAFCLPAI